jgi:DNA polymerase-3 subunit delta'
MTENDMATRDIGGVWDDVVGQPRVVDELARAALAAARIVNGQAEERARASGMTHAWLLTGPPGSGRSTAARAFAAALQCDTPGTPGCGHCTGCHTTLAGSHPDVEFVATELLSIGVKETRELVRRAALSPVGRRWQIIVIEDSDRLTEGAANVLLKAIEEPAPRTVWMLCAPSADDTLPTIRSRCRHLSLRTPSVAAVTEVLTRRDGVEPALAAAMASAAQGHIGRARRLALDADARGRRVDVLRLPTQVNDLGGCMRAAQRLVDAAKAEAKETAERLDARETEELRTALGAGGTGKRMPPGSAGALKELEARQKKRGTRIERDALDRALVDLAAFYRDVLAVQLGAAGADAPEGIVHADQLAAIRDVADGSTPATTVRRIEAVLACRTAIDSNVAPLLAVEAMTVALRAG